LQATGANINMPAPFGDIYGGGFGGGAHLDINLPVLFAFRVQGDYVTFAPDEGKYKAFLGQLAGVPANFSLDGGRMNILSGQVNTKFSPLPIPLVSPYLTAGAGLTTISVSDLKVNGQTVPGSSYAGETNFSANLGAGVDLNLIALSLYLEARYTWIFTSGSTSTYIPVSLGITF
jgi:opacity protein-like surface antigen